jgi:hypothetical protein
LTRAVELAHVGPRSSHTFPKTRKA